MSIPLPLTGSLLAQYNNVATTPPTAPLGDIINQLEAAAGSGPWEDAGGKVQLTTPSVIDLNVGSYAVLLNGQQGTSGQVFTSNGSAAPTWTTPAYSPATPANWAGPAPTTVAAALNRLAAAVALLSGPIP